MKTKMITTPTFLLRCTYMDFGFVATLGIHFTYVMALHRVYFVFGNLHIFVKAANNMKTKIITTLLFRCSSYMNFRFGVTTYISISRIHYGTALCPCWRKGYSCLDVVKKRVSSLSDFRT